MRSARVVILLLITLGLSACAADTQSRLLASQLRKMTAQYDAESSAKIEKERKFYTDAAHNLNNALNVVDPTATEQPDVRDTLAYGRIVTGTNSAALKLAGELVDGSSPASTRPKITAFIQDGITLEDQAFLNARKEQEQSSQAILVDFNAVAEYQTKLSDLVKQLAELEKPASSDVRISQVETIGQAVINQLKAQAATSTK